MTKMIIFILVACIGLALAIPRCASERQGTLNIKPSNDFPAEKKADLGRSVAKILPQCPGLARYGEQLSFDNISSDERGMAVMFSVPLNAALPADWGRPEKPCSYLITQKDLIIEGTFCQTLCLGRAPENSASALTIALPEVK